MASSDEQPRQVRIAARKALLKKLLEQRGIKVNEVPRIERSVIWEPAPLSLPQQNLWLFEQLIPGTAAYSLPAVIRLSGPVDLRCFCQSVSDLLRRHEILLTVIEVQRGVPVQVPRIEPEQVWYQHDLAETPASQREAMLADLIQGEVERPFEFTSGPLIRIGVISVANDDHVVVFNSHHIINDAWSWDVLLEDLAVCYRDRQLGRAAMLPPMPIGYTDLARWQRDRLEGAEIERQLAFWRQRLAGATTAIALPTDRPRPAQPAMRGSVCRFSIGLELTDALRVLGRGQRATLFMTLLAAFMVLLHRYTGQSTLVVGTPVANRDHPQVQRMVGFLVNTLLIQATLTPGDSFVEVLGRVRDACLDSLAHQDVSFDRVVQELPRRPSATIPLPQVMFGLREAPKRFELGTVKHVYLPVHNRTAKRDLTFQLVQHDEVEGVIEFDTELFDESTVRRMAEHYQRLLHAVVDAPHVGVADLPMLTLVELAEIEARPTTRRDVRAARCLHELIEEQVSRTPEAVAVCFAEELLTYRDLDERASRLAGFLAAQGIGVEDRVAVCLSRSLAMVVAVLGVLKAGAAYVPIDPADPAERLLTICQDGGVRVAIVDSADAERTFGEFSVIPIELDGTIAGEAVAAAVPHARCHPASLAYVLYTSGSTGRPKGVLVEHRQAVNYCLAILDTLGIDSPLSYAMVQPLTVDSCLTTLFPPLLTGGLLHIIDRHRALDGAALAEYQARHGFDVLKIAPSHLKALQRSPEFSRLLPKRFLVVGGEASDLQWMGGLAAATTAAIFNHYGPTEATVGVTAYPIREGAAPGGASTPIGFPLPNCRAYVLDPSLNHVPLCVPGELYLGGENVARGYCGRPELTAAHFLPDPFTSEHGSRMYRTGDIARFLPDGALEFLGRGDDQVKVRGFRVELGEVEAVLRVLPGVADAAVVALDDGAGDKRLVAFVAGPDLTETGDLSGIEGLMRQRLPQHMLPSRIVALERLPLSAHGKVDRSALSAPPARPVTTMGLRPRTELEAAIAELWKRLLRLDEVGVQENFFDLGGHSLLVIQLHTELEALAAKRFSLIELFKYTTVEAQAGFLGEDLPPPSAPRLDDSQERGRRQNALLKSRMKNRQLNRGESQ